MMLRRPITSVSLVATLLVVSVGCRPPSFYRRQADRDANCMVDLKSSAVGVAPGEYRIDIDPRSRMYDPNNPDCEPMPPDDPTSHQLMHCVDCKKGEKCWKCLPKTPFVENPSWHEYLPYDENGEVVLDLQGAVQLALLESTRFQSQLEELYLSALDVTFERFRFDTQFFGGSSIFHTVAGEATGDNTANPGVRSRRLTVNPSSPASRLRLQKLTATGGELVAGFANSLMWQFGGPDNYSSNTLLDFSFIQPLLRASGRGRVLERLTISERSLLANVRQMERFRRNFYFSIFSGDDPGQGPSRRGGFFGGSGLEGFSGVGGGGFGRVGGGGGFNGGFAGNTGGAGAQGAGGYLGLLQTAQVLRNQRANVAALRDSVLQLEASNEAGRIDRFQVDLARQALFNAQSQLLSSENQYLSSLENFKITLGLPPELPIKISDPMLDRLNLLDPDLEALQQQVADLLAELRQLREEQNADIDVEPDEEELVVPNLPAPQIESEIIPLGESIATYLPISNQIVVAAKERLAAVQQDFKQLEVTVPDRRENLTRLANRTELREANIDPALFDPDLLVRRVDKRRTELKALEVQLAETFERIDKLSASDDTESKQLLDDLIDGISALSGQLLELTLAQASARLEAITFSPIDLTSEQALAIAATYRRDWMNARANLVDAWRLIYFNANDLQSDLDLVFSGDLGNVGDNPFRFRNTNGRLRVGLEFDAPLTRLAERNVYRQALIEYQQARRNYYQFRDRVYQGLRNTLRQIRLNEVNFELRRAAVQVAISQVDLTQLRLSEPPKPGETSQFGSTTARDLVQSLSDLLNVQNDFLSVWVNYEVQRLNLEVDLGVMELAPNGLRIENDIPLETYLAGLPLNSSDLGPFVMRTLQTEAVELVHPESVRPEVTVPESLPTGEEVRPVPDDEPPSTSDAGGDIRLISAELPAPSVEGDRIPVNPIPLPAVEDE